MPTALQPGNPLAIALSRVGVDRYCWGGIKPPCFDCSGFVYWCFNQAGIGLARAMASQLNQGQNIVMGPPGNRLMNALPGDVVYFGLGNADPSRNHEGIISSTAGTGSMVNAECTACGPVNIVPIGEGNPGEPISAIRRFSSTNMAAGPSTLGDSLSTTDAVASADLLSSNCAIQVPLIDICIWRPSWGRALFGAAFILGASSLTILGIALLVGPKALRYAGITPQRASKLGYNKLRSGGGKDNGNGNGEGIDAPIEDIQDMSDVGGL